MCVRACLLAGVRACTRACVFFCIVGNDGVPSKILSKWMFSLIVLSSFSFRLTLSFLYKSSLSINFCGFFLAFKHPKALLLLATCFVIIPCM